MAYSHRALVKKHFNEPLLTDCLGLVRCIGYGEDDMDNYILARRPNPSNEMVWLTLVGGYYWLNRLKQQGKVIAYNGETWNDFTRLDSHLQLNGAPREPEFIEILRYEPPQEG